MAINPQDGRWQPNLAPKQIEIFNIAPPAKYVLVSGPVKSCKTIGCINRLLRHAFETPQARIGIFVKTIKSAHAGGVFTDLVETVLPEWVDARIGMKITRGPKVDGSTRLHHLWVSNMYGGNSVIQLHSLDYDFDVEAATKGMRFSCCWFSELSNFGDRIVFTTTSERLRMPHLRDDQHLWIGDTNPSDQGEDSWIYKLWYVERTAEDHPYPDVQAKYRVIECRLEDNIFMSAAERNEIFARYNHDEDLRNRYCHGLWTKRTEAGLFSEVFQPGIHVLGDTKKFAEEDWELLLPSENINKVCTGWDLGSKNHSVQIIEKVEQPPEPSVFYVLDEIVALNSPLPIADFTSLVVDRMDYWQQYIAENCHKKPILTIHWSDLSAFDQFRAALGGYDHSVVAVASEGRIMLQAAPKGRGSIWKRIDILRRLLYANRIFISARCVNTIQMLGSLRAGKTKMEPVENTEMRHVFDSLTYALASECFWELGQAWEPRVDHSPIVSVRK